MAVVKNDAYGHGVGAVTGALRDEVDGYAVADITEALALRDLDARRRILILQGVMTDGQLDAALGARLDMVVHSPIQLERLERVRKSHEHGSRTLADVGLWIKFDTGMHRLGFDVCDRDTVRQRVGCLGAGEVVMMSHLARASEDSDYNLYQQQQFDTVCAPGDSTSLANSAAILGRATMRHAMCRDWVRSGLALYGIAPDNADAEHRGALQPVMSVRAPVIALRDVRAGEPIGYGGHYQCPHDTRVAVVAAGYGHGYPYRARKGTPVWLGGRRQSVIGRVSMDMLTVALDREAEVAPGDIAELWGRHIPVCEVAECGGTIPYAVLCAVKGIPGTSDTPG